MFRCVRLILATENALGLCRSVDSPFFFFWFNSFFLAYVVMWVVRV